MTFIIGRRIVEHKLPKTFTMKKLYLLLASISLVCLANTSIAVTEEDDYFAVVCEEEQSTGFSWKDGEWVRTKFSPKKFTITKVERNESHKLCDTEKLKQRDIYESSKYTNSCYEIKGFGREASWLNVINCLEAWNKVDDGFVLSGVSCNPVFRPKIEFKPKGYFYSLYLIGGLSSMSKNDQRNSLAIAIGQCSTL